MPAKFFEQEVHARLSERRRLSAFLDELIKGRLPERGKISLQYIFCTDEFLLGVNREYLAHDTLTDIITFDLSDGNNLSGEIYISTERVAENAVKFGVDYSVELHRVIFHGALHLCGLGDKKAAEAKAMRAAEDACLQQYFKN